MSDERSPGNVRLNDGLGPDVTAWVCEYESGEVFVSLAENPMNDPNVVRSWKLLTMRERNAQVCAAVAAERERCATAVDHILREGGGTWGDWLRAGCGPNV